MCLARTTKINSFRSTINISKCSGVAAAPITPPKPPAFVMPSFNIPAAPIITQPPIKAAPVFMPPVFNIPAAPMITQPPLMAAPAFVPPVFNMPAAPVMTQAPMPVFKAPVFVPQAPPPMVVVTPPPFKAPVFQPMAPPPPPPAAPPVFQPPAPPKMVIPAAPPPMAPPQMGMPWKPPGAPGAAPATAKGASTVKGTTATEFATIDVDQMLLDAESETTPAPNAESAAFGGLDIGGMVGGFLGGFAAPTAKEDKPAEGAAKTE
jgi:hypothetical protein